MTGIFFSTFTIMLGAVGRIFLVIFISGLLVRKKVITQEHIKAMSYITVNVLLPAMLFSNITENFHPENQPNWWVIPLSCAGIIFTGMGLGYLFYFRNYRQKQFLIPLASMQNAVYLVLPIGRFMYPGQFNEFSLYNFLYLISFMPIVWSFGKVLITGGSLKTMKAKEFLTVPFIFAVASVLFVLLGLNRFIPALVADPIKLIGEATIPVSNVVLGATLGGISLKVMPHISDLIKITLIKYVLLPLITVFVLYLVGLKQSNPLLANMLVIEAAAAPATALIVQIGAYGGDQQEVGSNMVVSYIICLLAIPFWIAVWQLI